jgi:hypothetical protein
LNLQKSIDRIIELFLIFKLQIEDKNKAGFFDPNRLSEDVLVPIFRDIFDCPYLRNLNSEVRNYPGIDLADASKRTAFQITSDNSLDKIIDTLDKVIKHESHRLYDNIFIYNLKTKAKKYNKKKILEVTKGHFDFNSDTQIIDSNDLVRILQTLDLTIVQRVEDTLEVHLGNPTKFFVPQSHTRTESLVLNLVPITFPDELFIAPITYVRKEVMEANNKEVTDKIEDGLRREYLGHKSSERSVIWAALRMVGTTSDSAWVVRGNELLSFRNLRDDGGLAPIIDAAASDPIPVHSYITSEDGSYNLDHLNIFKDLLRKTFQAQFEHRAITWQHEERVFIFSSIDDSKVRKEAWSKSGGRMVYKEVPNRFDPEKTLNYEHLAFDAGFDVFEGQWFISIKPTMFYSFDGYNKSKWHKQNVSIIKRKDRNNNVLEDFLFIVEILKKDQNADLLEQSNTFRVRLGEPVQLTNSTLLDDSEWLKHEEKHKREALAKSADLPLLSLLNR